jgi:hypothetical protein
VSWVWPSGERRCRLGVAFLLLLTSLCDRGFSVNSSSREPARRTPPANAHDGLVGVVTVSFEGGIIARDILRTLADLTSPTNELPTSTYTIRDGDSLCNVFVTTLKLPACQQQELLRLSKNLNANRQFDRLKPGDQLVIPNLKLRSYTTIRKLDLAYKEDRDILVFWGKNWKGQIIREQKLAGSQVAIDLRAYALDIPVFTHAQLGRIVSHLRRRSPNIHVDIRTTLQSKAPLFAYKEIDPTTYLQLCSSNKIAIGQEGAYAALVGVDDEIMQRRRLQCEQPASQAQRPEVILVDGPVVQGPELAAALTSGAAAASAPARAAPLPQACMVEELHGGASASMHATHLAGIIASARNGQAFAGLSPESHLTNLVLPQPPTKSDYYRLWLSLQATANAHILQVYSFASQFDDYDSSDRTGDNSQLLDADHRFKLHLSQFIKDFMPLWFTAVGQVAQGSPSEFFTITPRSPQNLGDLRNVVVVTACKDCASAQPHIWGQAYFSVRDQLVHIAAPGGDAVPGMATAKSHVALQGTSPASAFVAGVAAEMIRCHPTAFRSAVQIKERLQVTARPFPNEEDARKVTSGIVDPSAALLDPHKTWLRRIGDSDYQPISILKWCTPSLNLSDAEGFENPDWGARTAKILRIVKVPGDREQWVIFTTLADNDSAKWAGKIRRIGPGSWLTNTSLALVVDSHNDGSKLTLGAISDLIISDESRPQSGDCRK